MRTVNEDQAFPSFAIDENFHLIRILLAFLCAPLCPLCLRVGRSR